MPPMPLLSATAAPLSGQIRVPGDKSISHRALMLGALSIGVSTIEGLLEGEDVLATASAMRRLGARVERRPDGVWTVAGRGVGGLAEADEVLDMGNAGTGARLLMGVVASHPFTSFFSGDASLRSRPMRRVIEPLARMGAGFVNRSGGRLPLAVIGAQCAIPITYELPVPSAQVKSAILLAGLNTAGRTTIVEKEATRDHTELMLKHFGAEIVVEDLPGGGRAVSLTGHPDLTGRAVAVPGDPSSAAFPMVAALLVPGSEVVLQGVGVNPLRTGLFRTLTEMGADIAFINPREAAGEAVADLVVRHSALSAVDVPASRAPSMIDEYPILAVAASFARGPTRMRGLSELRVKESDRLAAIAGGLAAAGVKVTVDGDDLIVDGDGGAPAGGAAVAVRLDHRIAMSFLVMGMAARQPMTIDDASAIDTSFPGFVALMNGLGARLGGLGGSA